MIKCNEKYGCLTVLDEGEEYFHTELYKDLQKKARLLQDKIKPYKRYFSAYGNKFRKYCSHDCYVMDRFWKNGNLNHVVPKSKIRAGIKDIVMEA